MRALARVAVFAAAVAVAAAPLFGAVTVTGEAPLVDVQSASPVQVLSAEAFERLPSGRDVSQLLLIAPGVVGGQPVDGMSVSVGKGFPKTTIVDGLPTGWTFQVGSGTLHLSGAALEPLDSIRVVVGAPKAQYGNSAGIVLWNGKKKLYERNAPIRPLNRVQFLGDPSAVIRLPQRISPGDRIRFRPLDPAFTPGAGSWRIGGLEPRWNGSFDKPAYDFKLPSDFKLTLPLRVSYSDPWGVRLVDGPARDVAVQPRTTPPAGQPTVSGCSAGVIAGDSFCVCGSFPTPEISSALRINGQPIGEYLVSSSPTILNFQLPASFAPGPLRLDADRTAGFDIADGARGVLIGVRGEIDRNKLLRGESTALRLSIEGTERPLSLRLWNSTPGVVSLAGGESQIVTTSGGKRNEVSRAVHAVKVGDFGLHFALDVDSCPCAESPVEQLVEGAGGPAKPAAAAGGAFAAEPPATPGTGFSADELAYLESLTVSGEKPLSSPAVKLGVSYAPSFFAPDSADGCAVTAGDCDELLQRALEAEATARALRAAAERARGNQAWMDRQAEALEREVEADREFLATLRRQAAEYRDLERAAADSLAQNERRAREQPQGGWEKSIAFDRAEVARRAGEAARLEAEAQALEAKIAAKLELAAKLRGTASDAEAAAEAAEALARAARAAYEACRAQLEAACPAVAGPGGLAIATGGSAGSASQPPGGTPPSGTAYCGPDASNAFTAALARVKRRMEKEVPASEKGALAGALFLMRNGWSIDQWPVNPIAGVCPAGPCAAQGNERGQNCYRLFGHCVPAHVLNDTMFGFTAALLGVPESIQDLGGNWAEGKFNLPEAEKAKYTRDLAGYLHAYWNAPDPAASRASYRTGNAVAEAWSGEDWQTGPELGERLAESGLLDEILTLYPSIVACQECPQAAQVTDWERDWSREEWRLSDGTPAEESARQALGVSP